VETTNTAFAHLGRLDRISCFPIGSEEPECGSGVEEKIELALVRIYRFEKRLPVSIASFGVSTDVFEAGDHKKNTFRRLSRRRITVSG
jgi:hypothetical protein